MRFCYFIINLLLLITVPFTSVHPESLKQIQNTKKLLYFEDVLQLIKDVETGEIEKKYRFDEIERMNQFFAILAEKGSYYDDPEEEFELENDVEALLYDDEYAFADEDWLLDSDGEIFLCKSKAKKAWKKTRKFVKKHKKAILIGTAVVAGGAVAITVATTAGGTVLATILGAAIYSESDENSPEVPPEHHIKSQELQEAFDEYVAALKDRVTETDIERQDEYAFTENVRDTAALLSHQILDEFTSSGHQFGVGIRDIGDRFLPENIDSADENSIVFASKERREQVIASWHETIDEVFSTKQAECFKPEVKENDVKNNFDIGIIPLPGESSKGINSSKFKEIISKNKKIATVTAEELGFSSKEIAQLEKTGALEKTVSEAASSKIEDVSFQESIVKHKHAKKHLSKYQGKYLSESKAKEVIHESGLPTFPRPKGVPDNYKIKLSKKGGGIKYVHPTDEGTFIRVMPGKPHSKNPYQRKPYINQQVNGKRLNKYGKVVASDSPESHISLEEFTYTNAYHEKK